MHKDNGPFLGPLGSRRGFFTHPSLRILISEHAGSEIIKEQPDNGESMRHWIISQQQHLQT